MNSKNYFKEDFKQQMETFNFMLTVAYKDPLVAMSMSAMDELPEGILTEVKESPIQGVGLFAKKDITAGQFITMYPIHQYAVKSDDGIWKMKSVFNDVEPYDGYGLDIDDNVQIYGCPTFHSNPMFNGHIANDPVMSLDHSDMNKFILSYYLATKVKGNAKYEKNKHMVSLVAVKDIKAGEEILVPYSLPYWFSHFGVDTDTMMKNFVKYLESQPVQKHKFIVDLMVEVTKSFD